MDSERYDSKGDSAAALAQKAAMQVAFVILIVLGALATLGVLVWGIVNMARGRDVTGETSNKLMSYRVTLQFLTVVFVVLLLLVLRSR